MESKTSEVNDVLITLNDYLLKLIPAIKECAKHYQSGQLDDGSNLLINMIEGLNWVIGVASINIDTQGNSIEEINIKLNEIVRAFENQDYILVGDILEYEILATMQELFDKTALLIHKSNR